MVGITIAKSWKDLVGKNNEMAAHLQLKKYSGARQTMCYVEFAQACSNYEALLKSQEQSMTSNRKGLDSAMKARIVGAQTKMKAFAFLLCLELAMIACS